MAVLNPIKVVIENYPEDKVEQLDAPNHPQKEEMGKRTVPFSREVYIDKDDFREEANKKYKRLVLGKEVRLRNAYVIKAEEVIKDNNGEVIEIRCSYDTETLNKNPSDGRKVKGVIHWVSVAHAVGAEVRLYDRLFNHPNPDSASKDGKEFTDFINANSLEMLSQCFLEANLESAGVGDRFQFEREGYFCRDTENSSNGKPIFNRTVTLRDTWAKIEAAS